MLLPVTQNMLQTLLNHTLENKQQRRAFRILDQLHNAVHTKPTVAYYEEKNQDIEHVLSIFIRRNSGGTTLSYSDLLLSIATSQWSTLDARKEVHQLVDDLNSIGPGLGLTKDFVLKAGLMLTDIASVGFQVRNFTQANMKTIENNWPKIRDALTETVQLVTGFGFNENSIRAASALLPISYYLYQIDAPRDFYSNGHYDEDRKIIRKWLILSILKASGIWGSGLDTLLTALREDLQITHHGHFPYTEMRTTMVKRGRSLEFTEEEIEDLADMKYGDRRIFALLALMSPFVDTRNHHFHIDHVFPKSYFTTRSLQKTGIEDKHHDEMLDCADRIGNLQLLDGTTNLEKQAIPPADWIRERYPKENERQHHCDLYYLGEIPTDLKGFMGFYTARRNRLQNNIAELVNSP